MHRARGRRLIYRRAVPLWTGRFIVWGATALAVALAFVIAPAGFHPAVRAAFVWDCGALTFLALIISVIMRWDPRETARRAATEDPTRHVILLVILASGIIGMVSALDVVGHAGNYSAHRQLREALIIGLIGIATSWALIHVTFALRYATEYYLHGDGIRFPGDERPSDSDFLYFALIIGMTFQTADVEITRPAIRRNATAQGLLAFVYNTAIIAVAVNVASGLIGK